MDPSPGNITPSWPVAIAHGMRNTAKPMIHQPNAAGPAAWITEAFVMNNTIATKIATMSKVVSTRGRMLPATRSDSSCPPVSCLVSPALVTLPASLRAPSSALALREVVEALVIGAPCGEPLALGPLDRQVRAPAERAQRLHQQFVGLQGVQGRAERRGQAVSPGTQPFGFCHRRRVGVDGLARVALARDPVQAGLDVRAERQVRDGA